MNGIDVIVNGFGHSNDNDLAAVFFENVSREVGCLCVGVVATNRVEDIDFVGHEALGSDFEGSLVFLDKAAGDAILDVGQLSVVVRVQERECVR